MGARRTRPDVHARTDRYLLPGAYMARVACGADAVDRSNASSSMLLDPDRGDWNRELVDAWEIESDRLPPVVGAEEVLGTVAVGLRRVDRTAAGLPGGLRLGDEMAATLGAGAVEAGSICDVLGTAEPVCAASDRPLRDPSRIAECHPHAAPGRWLLENPGWAAARTTAGSATSWAAATPTRS